jgi:RND family efflux transporter MFP subunit
MRRTGGHAALVLSLLCATAGGCGRDQSAQQGQPGPTEVVVTEPVTKEVTDYEEFIGHTEAMPMVTIRSRVTGYLDKVFFREGSDVKQGDQLFLIDPRPYQAALDQAVAQQRLAEANAKLAEAEYRRTQHLSRTGAASPEDVEKALATRDTANAQVKASQADVESRQLNVVYTKVTSPIAGRTSRPLIDPGNLVVADNTALTTVVTLDPMYAFFDVPERVVLRFRRMVRQGKVQSAREAQIPLRLGLADENGFPHEGTIDFVDNQQDRSTGTLWVRGVFPNKDRFLTPGLFCRVQLPVGKARPALLVPEKALGTDQGQRFVYVVNEKNEVVYRRVQVGSLHGGLRVVTDGLSPGERVIVSGLQRVRPGAPVDPKPADDKGAAPAAEAARARPAVVTSHGAAK